MPLLALGIVAGFSLSPAVALVVASVSMFGDALALRRSAERGRQRIEVTVQIARLVHELQKERGLSVAALTRRDEESRRALAAQRPAGSAACEAFLGGLDRAGVVSGPSGDGIAGLAKLRERIDAAALTGPEAVQAFSDIIAGLLSLSSDMVRGAARGRLSRIALALVNLMGAKEMSGQERALVSNVLGAGALDEGMRRRVVQAVGGQDVYLRLYRELAGESASSSLDADLGRLDPPITEVRHALLDEDRVPAMAVAEWFGRATARIDALKVHEDRMAVVLLAATDEQDRMARRRPWAIAMSAAGALAMVGAAAGSLSLVL